MEAPWLGTVAWWAGLAACAGALVAIGDLRERPRLAISILLVAGILYSASCWWHHRGWGRWGRRRRRRVLATILGGAILLRVVLLLVPPGLSDDVYRYRWDGRVQAAGMNPYRHPPASESLADLRDPLWRRINYPTIRTIYPPVAQWLFVATYVVDDSLLAFRLSAVTGEVLLVLLLLLCLDRWELPRWRILVYAWNPLAAVEMASSGHFDAWSMAVALAAVYAIIEGWRKWVSTTLAAFAVGFKTWPAALLVLSFRDRRRRHLLLATVLVTAAYLPYASAGAGIFQPWTEYAGRWLFNDAILAVLRWVTGSLALAKACAAVVGTGALLWLWNRGTDPIRGGYWILCLFILLLPAIHPWYLLWPLPLAAAALDVGWIALTVLAPLAYSILAGAGADPNQWVEPGWVRFALYVPPAALWWAQTRLRGEAPAPPVVDGST